MKDNIIIDDSYALIKSIQSLSFSSIVIIVLDNAGFELFTDLLLAHLIVKLSGCKIIFESKCYPWFVSDTTPLDFHWTLDACEKLGNENLNKLVSIWRGWIEIGQWQINSNEFWTTPITYWSLPTRAPLLYKILKDSDLVILKGDLNYRKMVHDGAWEVFGTDCRDKHLRKVLGRCLILDLFVCYEHARVILFLGLR